jgi:hypothetical protein
MRRGGFVRGFCAVALAAACAPSAWATGGEMALAAGRAEHASYATNVPSDAAPEGAATAVMDGPVVATGASGALVITPTFDSSITGDPNSAAIQAMINSAINSVASIAAGTGWKVVSRTSTAPRSCS